jgi:hypothetical protein
MVVASRNRRFIVFVGAVAVALAVALGVTLRGVTAVSGLRTEGHAIPIQGATAARVELNLDSGELRLGVGAGRLLDGAFTFNVDEWEPKIAYGVSSREGLLRIEQGTPDGPFPMVYGDSLNTWNLLLTPDVPLDLNVDLGEADGTFALGGLRLIGLEIDGDGGDAIVDLTGLQPSGLEASIDTDGGDVVLTLPFGVAVEVVVESGDVNSAGGLVADDDVYTNQPAGGDAPGLSITIDADGGDVTLITAPDPAPPMMPINELPR